MPRGPAPQWRTRKEPILDAHIRASVDQVKGVYDENGHYGLLVYAGCADRDRAKEISQALYRAARHLGFSVSVKTVKAGDGTYQLHFRAIDKTHAKAYVLEKYGTDRSKWAYDPRRRGN
jgi:hypothetical protein